MARKKKQTEIKQEFIPSRYQQDIFEFIKNGEGNCLVEAVAGSGKTTTIIEALKYIQEDKRVFFGAFNKDIVKVLTKKTKQFPNVDVRTIHGLGYMLCVANYPDIERGIDFNKYWNEFSKNPQKYSNIDIKKHYGKKYYTIQKNILRLLDAARQNLASTKEQIINLAIKYDITFIADEADIVLKLMEWGKNNHKTMDFTDMIWYPNVCDMDLSFASFDFIFVDEAQDLSVAQREFILNCDTGHTRYIFVGDGNQAIYGFSSADPESFNEIRKLPNIKSFPLSVSYRCPKSVVSFVNGMVKEIVSKDDAIEGEVIQHAHLDDVQDQDMILCRFNTPLFILYADLINKGTKAFIMGKDIGKNLIDIIKSTNEDMLNSDLEGVGVFSALLKKYFEKRAKLAVTYKGNTEMVDNDPALVDMKDNIFALHSLSEGLSTATQLIDKISKIFSDKISEGIILSTMHKAKGLEANNVYILNCNYKKKITQKWEEEQERNLRYVAYTRAKKKLGFLDEGDYFKTSKFDMRQFIVADTERRIMELYSGAYKPKIRRVGSLKPNNGKQLGDAPKKADNENLSGLFGKKKKTNLFINFN